MTTGKYLILSLPIFILLLGVFAALAVVTDEIRGLVICEYMYNGVRQRDNQATLLDLSPVHAHV